jgi:GntP family gluconate:H+ symporter
LPVAQIVGTAQKSSASLLETGFGGILGHIALIIGLGTLIGAILESSGGAEVLTGRLLRLFGEQRAPLAMGLSGLIFGIPVFFDVGIFVFAPLVYVVTKRTGKSIVLFAMPLLAGLSIVHAFLPPHPGPLVADAHYSQPHLALIAVAISAGSIIASHVNDGGFWMVSRAFGIPVRETLASWTALETVLSVSGFVVSGALSLII